MKRFLWILAVLAGGLGLALLVTAVIDRGPFERSVVGVEAIYWDAAERVGESPDVARSLPSPLYPRVLSPLASSEIGAVHRARDILTWISLPLIGLLTWSLARPRTGPWLALLAPLTLAAAAPLAISAGTFTPAVPAVLLALLALLLLDRLEGGVTWGLAGVLIALASRFHPGTGWTLIVLGLVASWLRAGRGSSDGRSSRATQSAGFGIAVLMTLLVTGPVLDTASILPRVPGPDVYRGHRVEASGVSPRRSASDPGRWWSYLDFIRAASRENGKRLDVAATDRYWTRRALKEAVLHPHRELLRNGVKGLAVFAGDPLPRDVSAAFLLEKTERPGLGWTLWLGRILLPLGLAGLLFARRRGSWTLVLGVVSGLLIAWWTFADEDGRLLSLTCLAVGVPLWADVMLRAPRRRRLQAIGASTISVVIWGLLPGIGGAVTGLEVQSDDYFQLGALYDREGRGSAAMREYERALRLDEDNPYPRMAIAGMLARDNMHIEAIKELEHVREGHPDFVPALVGLTRAYQEREMWREASAAYGDLVKLEPWNAEHWNNLATIYVQMALYDQADLALRKALEIDPGYRTAQDNLQALQARGLVRGSPIDGDEQRAVQEQVLDLIRMGNYPEAERRLEGAYERFGRSATLIFIEGTLRLVSGKPEEAVEALESVRDAMSSDPIYLNNLGASYMEVRNYEKAREVFREGLQIQPSNVRLQQGLEAAQAALDSLSAGED